MSTDNGLKYQEPEIWGGIECTINRTGNEYHDQLLKANHYGRIGDIEKIAELGIKKIRYPVLWEFHQKKKDAPIDWKWTAKQLDTIRSSGMEPIAGLLHHGSGPAFTQLDDPLFPHLMADYASQVAERFPWITYYTPVNEPLTTARFSGLYGHWYPHGKSDSAFAGMLINEAKATVLCMEAIRKVNPDAKLVQTEDLTYIHSTRALSYQAFFENQRRWLSLDLLCGKVDEDHIMYQYFLDVGIMPDQLLFFVKNPCPPDIIGFNYYVTSERYLDENVSTYPDLIPGSNGKHIYTDTEAVRAGKNMGIKALLKEAWERYNIPIAITECHLACSRDEQLRWLNETWTECKSLCKEGVDIKAFTAWALLGAFDWNSLLTQKNNYYEPGVFDISNGTLRPTAIAKFISSLTGKNEFNHPVLQYPGWWNRKKEIVMFSNTPPVMIIGKTGTLGIAFAKLCEHRSVPYISLSRQDIDICSEQSIEEAIDLYKPWAVINATGYVRVDDAETNRDLCFQVNATAPQKLAAVCVRKGIRFITFSSDLVFDGSKKQPYLETDNVRSLNVYGESKMLGEQWVNAIHDHALIIRSSSFFGPWDQYNFVYDAIQKLKNNQELITASNVAVSPTYVPDLVNTTLDLLIDEEKGIWHITNQGIITWSGLAERVAVMAGLDTNRIIQKQACEMNWKARRPLYSVLRSEKGITLPSFENALERYFHEKIA